MDHMMDGGMMWGMGLIGFLVIVLLVLAIAALVKYLFFGMAIAVMATSLYAGAATAQQGTAERGAQAFRVCAACHSLEPNKNMTGPSLAGVFDRKAGSLPSFDRYSPALKSSGVTWNAKTLDSWLADPAHDIPGNRMTYPGIKDARTRDDLIAFLGRAAAPVAAPPAVAQRAEMGGGMGGMMAGGTVPNLKHPTPAQRVTEIRYCRDSYHVTTADGETHDYWERNLRLKTDSGDDGPAKGMPALIRAGMIGDRGDVIFADPDEISRTIKHRCG